MSRKKVEFQDQDFIYVATLKVPSDRLRKDEMGRIVEYPELLSSFNGLVDAMLEAARSKLRFGKICVIEGAYIVDVHCVGGLTDQGDEIAALFERFNREVDRLELNAGRPEPTSAAACGVSTPSLDVLEAALEMKGSNHSVSVVLADGKEIELRAPSQDAITALPPREKKARKVDGEVTGMGWGDDRGCRVEIGQGSMYVVRGLVIEEAINLARERMLVSGSATWDRDSYVLDSPTYGTRLGI